MNSNASETNTNKKCKYVSKLGLRTGYNNYGILHSKGVVTIV